MTYDYIIAGSGCAGLSLLYRMLQEPSLKGKRILVIDKDNKTKNDRTWCFWEKKEGIFEPIVAHSWRQLEFMTTDYNRTFDLKKYSYKMIHGIDFYDFALSFAKGFENVHFRYEDILAIEPENETAILETSAGKYSAQYVFNSTSLFHPKMSVENSLLQHFEGWVIKTENPVFDENVGTLMDFRLDQKHGATFMYVLPTSSTEALVEYTLFSPKTLKRSAYQTALENYIQETLKIQNYEITHKETGIIPMSLAKFSRLPKGKANVINIGTAGGFTKASSGYTFQFIQKNTERIVNNLKEERFPIQDLTFREKTYEWYDRTLLEVLLSGKMQGREIFSSIFRKLSLDRIFAFLGNESSVSNDIKIMKSLPVLPFLKAGLKQLK